MNQWMERLDASVHHLGEARDVGDVCDGQARLGQGAGGAAGRDQFQAQAAQSFGQIDQAGLVGDMPCG